MSRPVARHALITGGGSGIGAAVAERLSAAGHRVTVVGRDPDKVEGQAARLAEGFAAACDVTDPASVQAAFAAAEARFGPVEILVNNAGRAPSMPFLKTSAEAWSDVLAVNLTGAFHCAQAALPAMLEAGFGRVVNVASTAGLKAYPYVAAYVAAKHGLVGLTRALSLEVARKGVTVNAVCPSFTDTGLVARSVDTIVAKTGLSAQAAVDEMVKANPQGRLVTPDEVAAAVAWLASDEASAINGVNLPVAGGEVG